MVQTATIKREIFLVLTQTCHIQPSPVGFVDPAPPLLSLHFPLPTESHHYCQSFRALSRSAMAMVQRQIELVSGPIVNALLSHSLYYNLTSTLNPIITAGESVYAQHRVYMCVCIRSLWSCDPCVSSMPCTDPHESVCIFLYDKVTNN